MDTQASPRLLGSRQPPVSGCLLLSSWLPSQWAWADSRQGVCLVWPCTKFSVLYPAQSRAVPVGSWTSGTHATALPHPVLASVLHSVSSCRNLLLSGQSWIWTVSLGWNYYSDSNYRTNQTKSDPLVHGFKNLSPNGFLFCRNSEGAFHCLDILDRTFVHK